MQQLTIEHKETPTKTTTNNQKKQQVVSSKSNNENKIVELVENKREGKGHILAISRRIYRLMQTEDVFYVESESTDNVYYYVKFKPDEIEWCTCPDSSRRTGGGGQIRCKHLHAIEFAIRLGTLKDTDRLPTEAKVRKTIAVTPTITPKSYTEDDYSF
jgi:predicted nucleic acid-binding Zn finger protein